MKFISTATITLRSGKGGDGIISWRRESKVRRGGPAGGSGGKGGSIYIECDGSLNSLFHIRHIKFLKAKPGENGRTKGQNGANSEDLILKVPCGTRIIENKTHKFLHELLNPGEKYLVCKGGDGGRGNVAFKSSTKPTPYLYELGDPYEEKEIILDLQTISNIGLLGSPNAGKSSLLSAISNAKPKVAPFPFTTVIPVLGVVSHKNQKLTFADIPGLVKNASEGAGLGFEFLKHLNRCQLILHLVDASHPNPLEEITNIETEIKNYSSELHNKPRILVLNKIDLLSPESLYSLVETIGKNLSLKPIPISALTGQGLEALLEKTFALYEEYKIHNPPKSKPDYLEISDSPDLHPPRITHDDNTWIVRHPKLKYWVYKIPQDTLDNIARLTQKIQSMEVNALLQKLGAKSGDLVDVHGWKYEF